MLVIEKDGKVIGHTTDIYTKYDEWNGEFRLPLNSKIYSESCFEGCHKHCTEQDRIYCKCTCHMAGC